MSVPGAGMRKLIVPVASAAIGAPSGTAFVLPALAVKLPRKRIGLFGV